MSGSLNKVMLIGNVGRAPEMRFTPSGVPTTTFSVATSRNRKGPDGEWISETDWHNVVAWRELAERLNEQLTKGTKVYVEGRIETRSWEGQDGQKRFRTEIIANTVLLLTPRNRDAGMNQDMGGESHDYDHEPVAIGSRTPSRPAARPAGPADEGDPDELPF